MLRDDLRALVPLLCRRAVWGKLLFFPLGALRFLPKGVYDVRGRLSDVLKKLDPKRFIMCNRSFVVNLRYVQSACNDYLTIDGTKISVSKSHRKEIMQHFSNFLGENV